MYELKLLIQKPFAITKVLLTNHFTKGLLIRSTAVEALTYIKCNVNARVKNHISLHLIKGRNASI